MTDENSRLNAQAELSKADAARRAARALADLGLYDDAASRLYYAAFHLISAALLCLGVQAQTHRGVAALLGQHLIKPGLLPASVGRDLAALMGLRSQADYNRHFLLDATSLAEELERVEQLFSVVGTWIAARGVPAPAP
ncbi:MAG TPA: HEPN domain-containing protein [Polyangiaceae bacterium]|nr:HEPN domain-containing protein [Polyangiaceae bacterium]